MEDLYSKSMNQSFYVYCESDEQIEMYYKKLSEDGSILMPLDEYDWSEKYAWVKDKFGVSWQLDIDKMNSPQKIVPSLLFVNDKYTKVKEASEFYISIFPNSSSIVQSPYPTGENISDGTLLFTQFSLSGNLFNAMSGAGQHNFDFNEAVSFIVNCTTQEEVDYYWNKLSEYGDPNAQQCGWLKDQFGISWQVVPEVLYKMINHEDKEKSSRAMNSMLQMKKLDIETLENAFEGN